MCEKLWTLPKAYEQHAEDCAQAAELTVDAGRREVYLKLARQWTEAAAALQMTPIPEMHSSSSDSNGAYRPPSWRRLAQEGKPREC